MTLNHEDVVIASNFKAAIVDVTKAREELIQGLVNLVHIFGEGHDPENFRGCTHRDCQDLRTWMQNRKIPPGTIADSLLEMQFVNAAAEWAYQQQVVDTESVDIEIGEHGWYADKEDWKESWINEIVDNWVKL